ncbi:MAG: CYTH domain-containing protein [Lentisphaeria bacterium]|nr:CYTH domain-containing protein [Lentisphaeria bacterium]
MGREIERKFLVADESFRSLAKKSRVIKQGYLSEVNSEGSAFRVRIIDNEAFLTLKGRQHGIERAEFEYQIPFEDAEAMMKTFCSTRIIEKTRYYVDFKGFLWEVDVFEGRHKGLMIAEIELENADVQFEKPSFAGEEVSDKFEYSNFYLSMN